MASNNRRVAQGQNGGPPMPDLGERRKQTEESRILYRDHHEIPEIYFSQMWICHQCTRVYGFFTRDRLYYQQHSAKCDPRAKPQDKWPWADFNCIVDLCSGCGQELLRSGSKWSVWFCQECKGRVVGLNTALSKKVIPIGGHSLMSGIGLSGVNAVCDEKIKKFVKDLDDFFASLTVIKEWGAQIVLRNLSDLGYKADARLVEYLERVKDLPPKSEVFKEMCEFVRNRSRAGKI